MTSLPPLLQPDPLPQRLMGASLLVFKNKSDVPGSMSEDDIRRVSACAAHERQVFTDKSQSQGLQLDSIYTHKWHILACSAISGENLGAGLEWVVQDAKDRLFLY